MPRRSLLVMVTGISKVLKPKVDEDRNQTFFMVALCKRVKEVISSSNTEFLDFLHSGY